MSRFQIIGNGHGICCTRGVGIPSVPGLDHQINDVSVFDIVLFEEFGVCERFAFKHETLCVRVWGARLGGKQRFDGLDGVGWLDWKCE